jgi:hypothetical protein
VADASGAFSSRPEDSREWFGAVSEKILAGQLQDWWDPRKAAGWVGAARYLHGYLGKYENGGGRHTDAYWREGHLDRLASAIAEHLG